LVLAVLGSGYSIAQRIEKCIFRTMKSSNHQISQKAIWRVENREKAEKLLRKRVELGLEISHMFEIELVQKELALLAEIDEQSTLFIMTINEAIDQNNFNLDDFELKYQNRVKFHNELWTYDIYLPLYLDLPKRKITIHQTQITKVPFKNIYNFVSRDQLIKLINQNGAENFTSANIPQYALHFSVTANNKFDAWNKISEQFNLFRGIIDFASISNHVRYTFGTASRTINDHPQWGLFRNTQRQTFEFVTYRVGKLPRNRSHQWNKGQLMKLKMLLRQCRAHSRKEEAITVVTNCLRLYAQAMESVLPHNCFLSLWQTAEALTRAEEFGGKTNDVLKRMQWHSDNNMNLRGLDISSSIKELAVKRNDLVHRGIDLVQNSDINLLKSLCDSGIKWLLENTKTLKTTRHLDEFYRLRTLPDKAKKAIIETAKSIK